MRNTPFYRQADLLVQVVPFVNAESEIEPVPCLGSVSPKGEFHG